MIRPFGDAALLVEVGETRRVHALAASLRDRLIDGVVEVIPGLDTLLVELDPLNADLAAISVALAPRLAEAGGSAQAAAVRHRSIPVVYGGELGPDLEEVARLTGLPAHEVIASHAGSELTVLICGFAPGFAYLGGLPERLAVPRLETPRTSTPRGSVAIAGRQSGIYPADLPGGWRVIGRTPVAMFDPRRDPPAYLAPGDTVRFEPIDAGAWDDHLGAADDW
ncbi:MAG: 5-oxoprolinase subunit PxpB [Candidatus Limnocylindria bacterium]